MYMYIMLHKNKHVFNVPVPWIFSSSGVSFPPSASTKVYQVILHVLYFILIRVKMGLKSMVFIGNKCK